MGGSRLFFLFVHSVLVSCCCAVAGAQDDPDEEPFVPGLIAEFTQPNLPPVPRLESVVAAQWSQRPDERLRSGELFTVTYRGLLEIPDDGSYQLHVHGNGAVLVKLDGKQLISQLKSTGWESSPSQQLTFGPLPIEVTFTAREWPARIALFWSSDRFEREPIPARALLHERVKVVATEFEQGGVLARALRCEACHAADVVRDTSLPAPALDALLVNRSWLVNWLAADRAHDAPLGTTEIRRRMPHLPITTAEAEAIADWLLAERQLVIPQPKVEKPKPKPEPKPKDPKAKQPKTNAELHELGQQLLLTKGCLACHQRNEFGESGLFGGGDLTDIAAKRPREFFAHWLQSPAAFNRDHRMPVFDLTAEEREALSFALSVSGKASSPADSKTADEARKANGAKARELVKKHRCDQCHRLPQENEVARLAAPKATSPLSKNSQWERSCSLENAERAKSQPQFPLPKSAAAALATYFSLRIATAEKVASPPTGEQLLIENNCLACHAREPQPAGVLPKKFGDKLVQLAAAKEEFAPQLASLTPPSLNSVGDKLTDEALAAAITRAGPAHRPYLQVQMPKFRLSAEQSKHLATHLIDQDRIPDYERTKAPEPTPAHLAARSLAGKRLIGTDGFSCTACHQVGSVQPVKAPPNARGPTLSMPQNRLRKTWFDRWVRNPARIVPRMEMPSVQTPVRGVLQDNLHEQLAAVWQVLGTPGFEPPLPEPVRTLRFYSSEDNAKQQPLVVTDLIEYEGQTLERAALIGLPNRQNILFDFATHRLLAWSQGDLARQRTKGKNWYWEPAGSVLLTPGLKQSELAIELDGEVFEAVTDGQWLADPQHWKSTPQVTSVAYDLNFRNPQDTATAPQTIRVQVRQYLGVEYRIDLSRRFEIEGLPKGAKLHWRVLDAKQHAVRPADLETGRDSLTLRLGSAAVIRISSNALLEHSWLDAGTALLRIRPQDDGKIAWNASYTSNLPADEYHVPRPPANSYTQPPVTIAPGFSGERISLPTDIMPTALAWRPNGDLVIASLKGQVLAFTADSLKNSQPQGELLADGLAAPYGIKAGSDYVDVVAKYGLLRLSRNEKSAANECLTIASGWGYTSDYHDWAVGLPCDADGNYYVALPCFQDNRADAAKRLRGSVLKLVRRHPTPGQPQMFGAEVLTQGHRFPMGMALNAAGELFVTDNQGNYNPFNELNHVVPGKHFGFVNKGQEKPKELTPPTIDIPHPWTRSVNGICFLDTPRGLPAKKFGPLEGHLVGCEYDTRRLIRMSLQKVDGEYQGCAYPLTMTAPVEEAPLGPICCEVSPTGELFVGSLRDSGWGAANNIGEVIRIQVEPNKLGHGLAEMRAVPGGFELHFFSPVEKSLADNSENYSLSSYRRESTPAYGGNDIDRRTEKVAAVTLDASRRVVKLAVDDLRPGHVYELRLKSLAPAGELFFPAEAHYTLRRLAK
jgi:cbb3-type cytochrome oxidase cytochrome c subunit/cytochrome c551/c552